MVAVQFLLVYQDLELLLIAAEDLHIGHAGGFDEAVFEGPRSQIPDRFQVQIASRFGGESHHHNGSGGLGDLDDLGFPDVRGEFGPDLVQCIADVADGGIQILAVLKLRPDHRHLVDGGGAGPTDLIQGIELLFDHDGHIAGDGLGRGAGLHDDHRHLGVVGVGEEVSVDLLVSQDPRHQKKSQKGEDDVGLFQDPFDPTLLCRSHRDSSFRIRTLP